MHVEILAYRKSYRMKFDKKSKIPTGQTQPPSQKNTKNIADNIKSATENHVPKVERQQHRSWITKEICG